jgi:hypothetical protein
MKEAPTCPTPGDVTVGGPPDRASSRPCDHQGGGRADGQQRLPARVPPDRRALSGRRGRRRRDAAAPARRPPAHPGRDHAPAPGPLAGAGAVVAATGARTAAGQRRRRRASRSTRTSPSPTATRCRSATSGSRSSPWSGTRRARSRCCTKTRPGTRTCSPATRCSRRVGNTRGDAANFRRLLDDVETKLFGRAARRDLVLPGPRQGLHARRRASPHLAEWRARGW